MNKVYYVYQQENELGEFFSLTMTKLAIENHINVEARTLDNILDIKNSVVFFVKFLHPDVARILKMNKNKIVLDMVDLLAHVNGQHNEYINHYLNELQIDKLLMRQKWVADILGDRGYYIPHHYDYRLDGITPLPHDFSSKKISFPYTDAGSVSLHEQFPDWFDVFPIHGKMHSEFDQIKDIHMRAMKNNFYFSIRNEDSLDYHFKPCTKTSTVAALNRNMIASTDRCLEDVLPSDYPYFFTPTTPEKFISFYENKVANVNKEEYAYGLECMRSLKERTNMFNQVELYRELFFG